jgi:hypothetical protein
MGQNSRKMQLLEKATMGKYRSFTGGFYTDMGNIFEDVTANYYSFLNNTTIHDFALIPCDKEEYSFLGASTDGVTEDLTNIEIKTLAGRKLDDHIKKEYYHQMQHQMFCLGLEKTHFLEAKYQTLDTLHEAISATGTLPCGIILEYYKEGRFIYQYSDIACKNLKVWERDFTIPKQDSLYIRTIYWKMTGYQVKTVHRDPQWILDIGPALKQFWSDLQNLKNCPQQLQEIIDSENHKKGIIPNVCLI